MPQIPTGSGAFIAPAGTYKAEIVNTYAFQDEFRGKSGPEHQRLLVQLALHDTKDGKPNGEFDPKEYDPPKNLWFRMPLMYTGNAKSHATKLWDDILGHPMTKEEKDNPPWMEWLIGVKIMLDLHVGKKDDGGDKQLYLAFKPKEPFTVDSLKAHWEKAGKPECKRPENFDKAGLFDGSTADEGVASEEAVASGWD